MALLESGKRLGIGLREAGYRGFVVDWDDFFAKTNELFQWTFHNYAKAVTDRVPGLAYDDLLSELQRQNLRFYHIMGPDPSRWEKITEALGNTYGKRARLAITDRQNVEKFHAIYTKSPRLKRYAYPTLHTLWATGLPVILNSLAKDTWIDIKLTKTRTKGFFSHVESIPVTQKTKTADDWTRAARNGGIAPETAIAAGDSRDSDAIPASLAHFRTIIWIPSTWSEAVSSGELPSNILRLRRIRDLIPALSELH